MVSHTVAQMQYAVIFTFFHTNVYFKINNQSNLHVHDLSLSVQCVCVMMWQVHSSDVECTAWVVVSCGVELCNVHSSASGWFCLIWAIFLFYTSSIIPALLKLSLCLFLSVYKKDPECTTILLKMLLLLSLVLLGHFFSFSLLPPFILSVLPVLSVFLYFYHSLHPCGLQINSGIILIWISDKKFSHVDGRRHITSLWFAQKFMMRNSWWNNVIYTLLPYTSLYLNYFWVCACVCVSS